MPRAEIATKQAMHTLLQLHAELGGKILDHKAEHRRLSASMKHVEAVLKMLAPDYDTRRIAIRRRKQNPWFKRGTLFRAVLGVLKTAAEPTTVREIAVVLLRARGISDDTKAIRILEGGVRSVLLSNRERTVARVGQGMPARWRLHAQA